MAREECYGAFPGGDPREFTPDPECSTEAEREAHRRACAIWDAGAQIGDHRPAHVWVADEHGNVVGHVARCVYGCGTYWIDVEDEGTGGGA